MLAAGWFGLGYSAMAAATTLARRTFARSGDGARRTLGDMGDNSSKQPQRARGRDGKFLPAAGGQVKLRGADGKTRTYRAADNTAARIAERVNQSGQQQQPGQGAASQ